MIYVPKHYPENSSSLSQKPIIFPEYSHWLIVDGKKLLPTSCHERPIRTSCFGLRALPEQDLIGFIRPMMIDMEQRMVNTGQNLNLGTWLRMGSLISSSSLFIYYFKSHLICYPRKPIPVLNGSKPCDLFKNIPESLRIRIAYIKHYFRHIFS